MAARRAVLGTAEGMLRRPSEAKTGELSARPPETLSRRCWQQASRRTVVRPIANNAIGLFCNADPNNSGEAAPETASSRPLRSATEGACAPGDGNWVIMPEVGHQKKNDPRCEGPFRIYCLKRSRMNKIARSTSATLWSINRSMPKLAIPAATPWWWADP